MSERMAIDASLLSEINGIVTEVRRTCGNCRLASILPGHNHLMACPLKDKRNLRFAVVSRNDVCDNWRQNKGSDAAFAALDAWREGMKGEEDGDDNL